MVSSLNYYSDKTGSPSTREEMFNYVETLLIKEKWADARAVFLDLQKIEFGVKSKPVALKLKEGVTPVAQAKALMNNALAWQMVQVSGSKTQYKIPTDEAIALFRSIPLSHDELRQFIAGGNLPQYKKLLITHHGGWDVGWVTARLTAYDSELPYQIAKNTNNVKLVRRVAEHIINTGSTSSRFENNGSNLDDETLQTLFSYGGVFYCVAVDPRITADQIVDAWEKINENKTSKPSHTATLAYNRFASAIAGNPNTPGYVLDSIVSTKKVYYKFDNTLLTHPNLLPTTLDYILLQTQDKHQRMLLARHPNARAGLLRKLSKSAYQPLSLLAQERLAALEKTKRK